LRDLAKSVGSFSWALSLFGAQQVLNLMLRPLAVAQGSAATGFDAVTRAAEAQLGSGFKGAFESGEQLQRSAVDLAFSVARLEALDPNRLAVLSSNVVRSSTAALRSLLPGGASGCCGGGGNQKR